MLWLWLACLVPSGEVERALDPDEDGFGPEEDCGPMDATVYPGAEEVCGDGVVNDCVGLEEGARERCRLEGELPAARADLKIVGEREGDAAGVGVSILGDVDGDGLADLLVGAHGQDAGGTNSGAAYLLYSSGALAGSGPTLELSAADLKIIGEDEGDELAVNVTSAGDVDDDGLTDMFVSAPYQATGGEKAGAAYLLLTTGALSLGGRTLHLGAADLKLVGEAADDWAGDGLSSAGDVDGDGRSDLLVGAPFQDDTGAGSVNGVGAVYLMLSSESLSRGVSTLSLSYADIKLVGEDTGSWAGVHTSSAGDVDGDGLADILVGAYGTVSDGTQAGAAYLLLTSGSLSNRSALLNLAAADLKLIGEEASDYVGASVEGAGDVDGDGRMDLLIGAHGHDLGGLTAGASYLVLSSGSLSTAGATLDLAGADLKIVGEEAGEGVGYMATGRGDTDGDGRADVVIGSKQHSGGGSTLGATYLLLSSGTLATHGSVLDLSDADFKLSGDDVGSSVSTAGDVDGDGLDDIFIGAAKNDTGGIDAGAAYLLFGRSF